MSEPTYDITIGAIPETVKSVAESQAVVFSERVGRKVEDVKDMLIIQRRIGELVLAYWSAAHPAAEFLLGTFVGSSAADPSLIKHKRRTKKRDELALAGAPGEQLDWVKGECADCCSPGERGTPCSNCGGEIVAKEET